MGCCDIQGDAEIQSTGDYVCIKDGGGNCDRNQSPMPTEGCGEENADEWIQIFVFLLNGRFLSYGSPNRNNDIRTEVKRPLQLGLHQRGNGWDE